MNSMLNFMNSVAMEAPCLSSSSDPVDTVPMSLSSPTTTDEEEDSVEKPKALDEKVINARVAREIEVFQCTIPPLPANSGLSENIWAITQTSRALEIWLTKHLGEDWTFSPVELTNGTAIEKCLEHQRIKLRRQLLEDTGIIEIPSLNSVITANDGLEMDAVMAGDIPPLPLQAEPAMITVEEDFETHPVRRVPEGWPVRRVYVINIPEGVLRYNATKLGDFDTAFNKGLAHKVLVYLMGKCSSTAGQPLIVKRRQNPQTKNRKGSESTNEAQRTAEKQQQRQSSEAEDQQMEDSHRFDFCPNGDDGPKFSLLKTTQVIEQVTTVTGENKGWRIFFFIHGDNVNLAHAMSRQIQQNLKTHRRQLATANNKTGNQRDRERKKVLDLNKDALCYENPTTNRLLLTQVVLPYISYYDTKMAEEIDAKCAQERKIDRLDDPDGPLHPRHYLGLEQALRFSKLQGVRDRQTELLRYRQPVNKAVEDRIQEALACEDTLKCIKCGEVCNKMLFNPLPPAESEAAAVGVIPVENDDSRFYGTSSSDEEDEELLPDEDYSVSSSSSTTSTGTAVTEPAAVAAAIERSNQICCECTHQTKICEDCKQILHLSNYDNAHSPVCSSCSWIYCFPQPYACWRIRIDDMSPEGLHEMHLPHVKTAANNDSELLGDRSSYIYSDAVFNLEGGILDSTKDEDIQQWEESMQIGTNNLLCPGLDPLTATLTSMSDKIVDRSRLLQLRKELIPKRMLIESTYLSDPEIYQEKMGRFKEEACLKFWKKIWGCEPANEFSPVTIKAMAYLEKHMPDRLWPEHNQIMRNLSLYGNMRLFFHVNFTRHFRLKEGLMPRSLWKLVLARDSALEYDYGLRVNILEDGEGSTGKSYNMDCMSELSFEGSIHKTTHISPQAFNTDQDWNYVCIVMHECPLGYLGIDAYGHQVEGCEFIKDRLTSNVCQSDRCNWEGGKASRSSSFSRCMGNMIMATNANPPPTDTPLMQRFLREVVIKYPGGSYDVADIAEPMGDEMDQQTKALFVHESRMRHVFIMIVERAIESGFFHDVNTNLVVMYFKRIFKRLHDKYKIPKTPIRIRHMLLKLCRIACIKHAVYWEYCTEISLWRFEADGKTFREFDPHSLINLERKLVVTEEMIADILSLFQDSFIPTLTQKFLEQCKELCGLDPVTKTVKNHRYKRYSIGNGREQTDYNYVEFDEGSLGKFYDIIWNKTKGQLTPGIVSAKLLELKKRFIEVDNRNYNKQLPAGKQQQRPAGQFSGQGPNRQLWQKQNQAKLNIPCAEVIQKPGGRRSQSVCIAIDAMCVKLDEQALCETLKWALSHAWARPRRIITSFVHIGPDNYAYPHLLHTIDVERNKTRVLSIRNHLAVTRLDEACVYNRIHSNTYHTSNSCMASDFITVWGEDAETSTYRMHWRKIGAFWPGWGDERFSPLTSVPVYALDWIYVDRIWEYRDKQAKDSYKTLIEFQTYPDDCRLLHQARLANAKSHLKDLEGQKEGLESISTVMSNKLNPRTAIGTYRNWGLTTKCFVKRTKQKRNLVERFCDIAKDDPLNHLPENTRSSVFIRKRQETIQHKQLVQKAFEEEVNENTDVETFEDYDDAGSAGDAEDFNAETYKRSIPTTAKGPVTKKSRSSYACNSSEQMEKTQQRGMETYLKNRGSFSDPLYDLIHMSPRRSSNDSGGGGAEPKRKQNKSKNKPKDQSAAQRIHSRREARRRNHKTQKQRRKKAIKKKRRTSKLAKKMEYDYYHDKTYSNKIHSQNTF